MGNEAIAVGAMAAGVRVVSGYPGTPSTEVLETVAKRNNGSVYVEWSVNEKAAMEVAAGAAYAGARAMVTMKQVGLNACSDPLMCVNYVGVKGGLVVLVADDPGPISSQTEQDTRHFGRYARIPVFDPTTPEQAYQMVQDAFELSEQLGTPVILRPTTRICHSCASIDAADSVKSEEAGGHFEKDPRWVIFPKLSYMAKRKLFSRESELSKQLSYYGGNTLTGSGRLGIACGGVSAAYAKDVLKELNADPRVLTVATPYPFPDDPAIDLLKNADRVLCLEELDPVIEDALIHICGREKIKTEILGKRTGHTITAGENSHEILRRQIGEFLGIKVPEAAKQDENAPELAVRPPILCAGCPHRASFYAVKQAMRGKKAVFSGDIGCYTLGNAAPLNTTDTCLCMGAGFTVPQGLERAGDDAIHIGFVGDSTFFHSGITGIINAVYNRTDMIAVVLDNSTTAMTGHQPHPGIGKTMMGDVSRKISIEKVLNALEVTSVRVVDPLDLAAAVEAVKQAAEEKGVRCIVFRSPCIAIVKPAKKMAVKDDCRKCQKCIRELGCPALSLENGRAVIEPSLCTGCGLCAQVCPFDMITEGGVQ
ncbi:MAG: indolepyruvate ferredoxin oxidoreductase subunit alpha [Clostridia bacterium]|nr:indolepyruvate ferredoxin oxidoreductase subunit alpha [Clostridia bacterium]